MKFCSCWWITTRGHHQLALADKPWTVAITSDYKLHLSTCAHADHADYWHLNVLWWLRLTEFISVIEGLRSWSVWHISWSSAVHGLWRAQERLQQVQESALWCKAGESSTPWAAACMETCPKESDMRTFPFAKTEHKVYNQHLKQWLTRFLSLYPPPCSLISFSLSTECFGIYHNGSTIQNLRRGHDIPISGGASSPARPAQYIQRCAWCHQTDMEVKTSTRGAWHIILASAPKIK